MLSSHEISDLKTGINNYFPFILSLYLSMCLQLWFSTGDGHAPQRMYDKAWRHFLLSELGQGFPLIPRGRSSEMLLHTPQHTGQTFLPLKNYPAPKHQRFQGRNTLNQMSHAILTLFCLHSALTCLNASYAYIFVVAPQQITKLDHSLKS